MKCRSCKMNLPNSWNVCPNCGTSTQSKAESPSGRKAGSKDKIDASQQTKNYKKITNILLLAGIGLYILLKLFA